VEGRGNSSKEVMDVSEIGCENVLKAAHLVGMKLRVVKDN
jgi:hypothetical protein